MSLSTKKAVVLAGGRGKRIASLVRGASKHLLPIGNESVIRRGLHSLVSHGVREILVITNQEWKDSFIEELHPLMSRAGVCFQASSGADLSLAEVLIESRDFVHREGFFLFLADNVFFQPLTKPLSYLEEIGTGILLANSESPSHFGVPEIDHGVLHRICEKPRNLCGLHPVVTGLGRYDESVYEFAEEICNNDDNSKDLTDIHNLMIERNKLRAIQYEGQWFDIGTPHHFFVASRDFRKISTDHRTPDMKPVYGRYNSDEIVESIEEILIHSA